jgi:hypothetical protein
MFGSNDDLGAALYATWTAEQRQDEINKLVQGFRAGLPVGVLCKMVEAIAGSQEAARTQLTGLLTLEERQTAVAGESGGMKLLMEQYLL